jgi:hypothetical protein
MNDLIKSKIEKLSKLGKAMSDDSVMEPFIQRAYHFNPWFTPENSSRAIRAIITHMLDSHKLSQWLSKYETGTDHRPHKTIGLIMAGNLPLVGFHDFLCAYVTGFDIKIKLSSKDDVILPHIIRMLAEIDEEVNNTVHIVDRLEHYDAVIATGSNNSNRYFEYYFRSYPKILRRNRSSIAILSGTETAEQLYGLTDDICVYFGFGCRNVSKLYVPEGYDVRQLFPYLEKYKWMHDHTKYMNNYDYNRTLLLMNSTPHLSDDIVMLQESESISSPVAVVYYEYYTSLDALTTKISTQRDSIQCIVADKSMGITDSVDFGQTQSPELWDYADGVDTISFLLSLGA